MVIIVIAVALYLVYTQVYQKSKRFSSNTEEQLIGGQTDEHGCLGPAGYTWCEAKQKCLRIFEEACDDTILEIASEIAAETGVNFENLGETNFDWLIEAEDETQKLSLNGLEFRAKDVTQDDYNKVDEFFNANYENDNFNAAAGVMGGLTGYWAKYNACLVGYEFTKSHQDEQGMVIPETDTLDVYFKCAFLNKNDLPKISTTKEIQKLLAEKYDKKLAEVNVTLSQVTDNHVRGSVVFATDGVGEGGIVLAAKVNDDWQLVFDGNGSISCELVNQYNFPQDMITDCYDETQ